MVHGRHPLRSRVRLPALRRPQHRHALQKNPSRYAATLSAAMLYHGCNLILILTLHSALAICIKILSHTTPFTPSQPEGDYKSPRWISGQVRNLISKILVTEPSKRYTLSDIKRHVWYGAVDKADIPRDVSTGALRHLLETH